MTRLKRHGIGLITLTGLIVPGPVWSDVSVPVGYRNVAEERGIPPALLYAVALTESAKKVGSPAVVRPWPWTLNIAGRGFFFDSRLAAWKVLTACLATPPALTGGPVWAVTTHRRIHNALPAIADASSPNGSGSWVRVEGHEPILS